MFGIHKKTNSLFLKVDDPLEIRGIIPQSQTIPHPHYNVAVKHTLDNVKVLRNLGIEAPIPDYIYPGKYTPYDHQRIMLDFYVTHDRGFNLSDMGAMKTAPTCWAADYLMNQKLVQRAAVLCPLSTVDIVWKQEIFDTLLHRQCAIVHGGKDKRLKALNMDVDFYIINHDGLCTTEVFNALRKRKDINLLVVDEGSMFRNARTDKYKALKKCIMPWHRIWWLTGAPTPQAPTDAWAQARLINKTFANQYEYFGVFQRETMESVSEHRWVTKPGAYEKVYTALRPAVRFKKEDCISLPPVVTVPYQAKMSDAQRRAFNEMKDQMVAMLATTRKLTAVNAADKINKLRQILCGVIKDASADDYIPIPHGPRLDLLTQIMDSTDAKSLIIVPFKGIITELNKELTRKGYSVGVVNGDVAPGTRDKIFKAFKNQSDPQHLLCHPKVMAHGLNLTEADLLIFYAPIYSNDEYGQVIQRFNRAGQTRKMTIARMAAHPLEWSIYKMVDTRKSTQEDILELFKTAIADG